MTETYDEMRRSYKCEQRRAPPDAAAPGPSMAGAALRPKATRLWRLGKPAPSLTTPSRLA